MWQLEKAKQSTTKDDQIGKVDDEIGLKVNIVKTELTIFHRIDTGTVQIIVKKSFDYRMQWYIQVEKAKHKLNKKITPRTQNHKMTLYKT